LTTDRYPNDQVPRDPDPPERAVDVDKQEPGTPPAAPEPVNPEVESARLLANEARPVLGAEGFSDLRIDELADAFIARNIGQGGDEFVRWAREQGQFPSGEDRVL
jgi:hypothetical protein